MFDVALQPNTSHYPPDCTALRIILPKRKRLVVVASYRPPDVDSDLFLDSLEDVITPHLSANL